MIVVAALHQTQALLSCVLQTQELWNINWKPYSFGPNWKSVDSCLYQW